MKTFAIILIITAACFVLRSITLIIGCARLEDYAAEVQGEYGMEALSDAEYGRKKIWILFVLAIVFLIVGFAIL